MTINHDPQALAMHAINHEAGMRAIAAMPEPQMMTDVPACAAFSQPLPAPCEFGTCTYQPIYPGGRKCTKCGDFLPF